MKNLRVILSSIAALVVVSSTVAQTADIPQAEALSELSSIAAARSQYLEKAADASVPNDSQAEARLPRPGRGTPIPPRHGYNMGGYPTPWTANSDPRHALIGAGIGFAIGATIGAVGSVQNRQPVAGNVLFIGSLFALFGGAIGASDVFRHPLMHRRRIYRPSWPQEDEEGTSRSRSKHTEGHAELSVHNQPGAPKSADDGPKVAALPRVEAIP